MEAWTVLGILYAARERSTVSPAMSPAGIFVKLFRGRRLDCALARLVFHLTWPFPRYAWTDIAHPTFSTMCDSSVRYIRSARQNHSQLTMVQATIHQFPRV